MGIFGRSKADDGLIGQLRVQVRTRDLELKRLRWLLKQANFRDPANGRLCPKGRIPPVLARQSLEAE